MGKTVERERGRGRERGGGRKERDTLKDRM